MGCHSIMQQTLDILYQAINKFIASLCHCHRFLTRKGYRVWYDQVDVGFNLKNSMRSGIGKSTLVIACPNVTIFMQSRENCIFALKEA